MTSECCQRPCTSLNANIKIRHDIPASRAGDRAVSQCRHTIARLHMPLGGQHSTAIFTVGLLARFPPAHTCVPFQRERVYCSWRTTQKGSRTGSHFLPICVRRCNLCRGRHGQHCDHSTTARRVCLCLCPGAVLYIAQSTAIAYRVV